MRLYSEAGCGKRSLRATSAIGENCSKAFFGALRMVIHLASIAGAQHSEKIHDSTQNLAEENVIGMSQEET